MKKYTVILSTALLASTLISSSHASVIGYWTFDDGTPGTTASSVATEVNSPALDGTAMGNAGGLPPQFHTTRPGPVITDGISGPTVNADNATSLEFNNTGLPGNPDSHAGGRINVTDPGGPTSVLKPASFTVEAFVRIDQHVNFNTFVSKSRADSGGSTWLMDMTGTGEVRARFDSQTLGTGGGGVPGFNQNFSSNVNIEDGLWHHIALTYNGVDRQARLYIDYVAAGAGATVANALVYDDNPLFIGHGGGGRATDGWIDEVRLSDQVLTTDQFLRAIPEPGSMLLMGLGTAVLLACRRLRQQNPRA